MRTSPTRGPHFTDKGAGYNDAQFNAVFQVDPADDFMGHVSSLSAHFATLLSHPPAEVSSTVRANPLGACSEALSASLLSCAKANPISIDALVQPLVRDLSTTEDLRFTDEDAGYIDALFNTVFMIDLDDLLSQALHEKQFSESEKTKVSPKNTFLSLALFSGSAIRNKLLRSKEIYAFAEQGLQLPGATIEREKVEIVAIGACLLLLLAGNDLLDTWMAESNRLEIVVKTLEALEEKKVIKYPTGVDLLERTIGAAKGGFTTPVLAADAWTLLFP